MPFALPLLLLGLLPPGPAPEPAYELRWSAPSSCPGRSEVVDRIEELSEGGSEPHVHVTADATVEHAHDRWSLSLRISTTSGSRVRTVETDDCDELATLAALSIAIAIDPGLTAATPEAAAVPAPAAAEPEAPPPPALPVQPEPVQPEPEPEPPSSTDTRRRALRASAMARVGLSTGMLPSVVPAVHVGGGLWWKLLGARISVVHRLPLRFADGRAELWTLAGDVRGCAVPRTRTVSFPLCAGVEVGMIAGRSFRVSAPGRGRAPWLALHAGGGLVARVSRRIGITVDAGLVIPVIRASFEIEGIGELHRVGAIGLDANVGVEVIFP
jgi:hypothetical protein